MKSKKLYIGIAIGFSLVIICTGVYAYRQAHKEDVKSIIYVNPLGNEELEQADFAAFEKLVDTVEEKGELVENPELRCGSYGFRMTFRNGREKDISINATYCYIDGKCYFSSLKLCKQFVTFFEAD